MKVRDSLVSDKFGMGHFGCDCQCRLNLLHSDMQEELTLGGRSMDWSKVFVIVSKWQVDCFGHIRSGKQASNSVWETWQGRAVICGWPLTRRT